MDPFGRKRRRRESEAVGQLLIACELLVEGERELLFQVERLQEQAYRTLLMAEERIANKWRAEWERSVSGRESLKQELLKAWGYAPTSAEQDSLEEQIEAVRQVLRRRGFGV